MFYVYVYLDPRKTGPFTYGPYTFSHEPFYIGYSGNTSRMRYHIRQAKKKEGSSHPKYAKIHRIWKEGLEPMVYKYRENLDKTEACDLEHELVMLIGRQDLSLGPLTNLSDGGEKSSFGARFKTRPKTLEEKEKIGKTLKEYSNQPEIREKLSKQMKAFYTTEKGQNRLKEMADAKRGRKQNPEQIRKRANSLRVSYALGKARGTKGKRGEWHLSEETRKNISERMKNIKMPTGTHAAHWKGYIYSVELDKYWETAKQCAAELKISFSAISWRIKRHSQLWYYTKDKRLD